MRVPILESLACAGLLLLAGPGVLSPALPGPLPQRRILEGHRRYYAGDPEGAAASYRRSLKTQATPEAWLNLAVVLGELGRPKESSAAYEKALLLDPQNAEAREAYGESLLRRGSLTAAETELDKVLLASPAHAHALIAKGRLLLAGGRSQEAAQTLARAAEVAPEMALAHYWLGRARDAARDPQGALDAYRKAVQGDSYFAQARYHLSEAYAANGQWPDAWRHGTQLIGAESRSKKFAALLRRLHPSRYAPEHRRTASQEPPPPMPVVGGIPILRIGIGTTALGRPLKRRELRFFCNRDFSLVEGHSGRLLAQGRPGEAWTLRPWRGHPTRLELTEPNGKRRLVPYKAVRVRSEPPGGIITLQETFADPAAQKSTLERPLRGDVEFSLLGDGRSMKIVNIVDLESYTHGVLAAEMPVLSPMEALKSQAVLARTHAVHLKTLSRRHAKDGYHLCDGQHCQVYAGVRIESERSRAVVEATRGRVLAYQGRIAHVPYSSNCGGHTQNSRDLKGWGDLPYLRAVSDADPSASLPASPWELRLWLRGSPAAYCRPSSFVHASHFRWARVIPAEDLEEKIRRGYRIGRLLAIQTLQRSVSGHLNSMLIRGSQGRFKISNEIVIRSLFGVGSQRSALFTLETEYGKDGRPSLFIFYGGGWGHGVGLCQSGAMGRAQEGHGYPDILKAYFPGTELGDLRY